MIDRRQFVTLLGAGGLGMLLNACGGGGGGGSDDNNDSSVDSGGIGGTGNSVPTSGTSGRVVIVGGGMAGATAAKFLRLWGGSGMDVTLVERDRQYQSNILSNLVLTGQRSMASLAYTHAQLASAYGVKVVYGEVAEIDPAGRRVLLADRSSLPYDRLILAPGIAFDTLPGLEGAGDSFVAAFVLALAQGQTNAEALALGSAAASAAVTTDATQLCRPEDVMRLLRECTVSAV